MQSEELNQSLLSHQNRSQQNPYNQNSQVYWRDRKLQSAVAGVMLQNLDKA
ncbi:hypothetical protein [uncultured Nostoc sp.]|uniref:hypothetical protein n=1 Tax=uncultured Nostoc sp. TaxID=340711 RepID=UPI0035CA3383